MVITAKDLEYSITIDNIKEQIKDGWTSSNTITKNIIGDSIWITLHYWDKTVLIAKTHEVIIENNLLQNE